MQELVEQELTSLQIGTQIAKRHAKRSLNQTQLAARARMSAPEISKIESKPANVQLDTLIRMASALGAHVEMNRRRSSGAVFHAGAALAVGPAARRGSHRTPTE